MVRGCRNDSVGDDANKMAAASSTVTDARRQHRMVRIGMVSDSALDFYVRILSISARVR